MVGGEPLRWTWPTPQATGSPVRLFAVLAMDDTYLRVGTFRGLVRFRLDARP